MKKFLKFIVIFIFLLSLAYADEKSVSDTPGVAKTTVKITIENKTVYDVIGHIDLASNILLSWGALSTGTGILLMTSSDNLLKSLGMQNTIWGAAEIGAAMWVKGLIEGKKESGFDEQKEKQRFQDFLGLKFFIDLGMVGVGSAMYIMGNEQIKGHGAGILIQGFSLALFDGINYLISKNLSERFKE